MTHPLEPISAKDINTALEIFHKTFDGTEVFFSSAGLLEPPKHIVKSVGIAPRIVKLLGVDNIPDGGFVAEVDLTSKSASISRLPGDSQVPYSFAELGMAVMLTKQNEAWLEAIVKRGIPVSTEKALKKSHFSVALLESNIESLLKFIPIKSCNDALTPF